MLTEDQIKNLKPGDPVIIEATFCKLDCVGDVVSVTKCTSRGERVNGAFFAATSHVSLPQEKPKYDPTRLFKKGDKVRVVEWNGRKSLRDGKIGQVLADEIDGCVELSIDGWPRDVYYHASMLELVTPIEEIEPYSISEEAGVIEIRNRKREVVKTWYYGAVKAGVEALAAAQTERDRLNAAYRKEQK